MRRYFVDELSPPIGSMSRTEAAFASHAVVTSKEGIFYGALSFVRVEDAPLAAGVVAYVGYRTFVFEWNRGQSPSQEIIFLRRKGKSNGIAHQAKKAFVEGSTPAGLPQAGLEGYLLHVHPSQG